MHDDITIDELMNLDLAEFIGLFDDENSNDSVCS